MALSAVEISSVRPGGGLECRGECSLGVEVRSSLTAPSTASWLLQGSLARGQPFPKEVLTFLCVFLVCLLGLLSCIYSLKNLPRDQSNSAKVPKDSYPG